MEGPVCISNAICWSPDDKIMYFADSLKRTMWAYDFDASAGTIENRRTFIEVPEDEGVPDGATVDADGFVWVAHMRGGRVKRYDPDGKVEQGNPVSGIADILSSVWRCGHEDLIRYNGFLPVRTGRF